MNDDLDLPCGYCCGWDENPDDQYDFWPINPDGTRIPELRRTPHPRCQQMVDEYMAEQKAERDARGFDV